MRRLAELRLALTAGDAKHFLGAIVVHAQEPILGDLQASSIIDGQQRLTTLQLLMDATAAALEARGQDALARQLDRLTQNEDIYVPGEADTRLKLRHSNKDGAAFEEVMDAEAPVDHETLAHAASRVVRKAKRRGLELYPVQIHVHNARLDSPGFRCYGRLALPQS